MNRSRDSLIWGILILIVGLLFLLWNFGVFSAFEVVALWVIAGIFALAGLAFLVSYIMAREDWWKVIPGFTLLAVGALLYLGAQKVAPAWLGVMLFIGIALAFAVIYVGDRRERWWALLPFGSMIVMVAMVLLDNASWPLEAVGAVLFGGMGLVFLFIYLLAPDRSQFHWALIPMSVLLIMGFVALAAAISIVTPGIAGIVQLWPILLVVLGVYLLGKAISGPPKLAEDLAPLSPEPAPVELPSAPGTSITELPEDDDLIAPPTPIEHAPITLVEEEQPEAEAEPGEEVPDIYEFLKAAPPEPEDAGTIEIEAPLEAITPEIEVEAEPEIELPEPELPVEDAGVIDIDALLDAEIAAMMDEEELPGAAPPDLDEDEKQN